MIDFLFLTGTEHLSIFDLFFDYIMDRFSNRKNWGSWSELQLHSKAKQYQAKQSKAIASKALFKESNISRTTQNSPNKVKMLIAPKTKRN